MRPLVELRDVAKRFQRPAGFTSRTAAKFGLGSLPPVVHAVDGVSFSVAPGEVVGLVGESGCGKSTVGRLICGLIKPSDGMIVHSGRDKSAISGGEDQRLALRTQMVFQSPYASLNPRMSVRDIVGEAALAHGLVKRRDYEGYVDNLLKQVGLDPRFRDRLPHQFSGGQRQRIGIARALAVKPDLVVCDEAVAALDVSIQAQVLNLLMSLRKDFNLSYVFISHDLRVVSYISDRIVVMYLGRIVETASADSLFERPFHPYTAALLASAPGALGSHQSFYRVKGEIPSPLNPPAGCHFHPRCPHAEDRCRIERPALRDVAPGRQSACHFAEKLQLLQ